jgi:UDPglucose 6-dehydrogenase
MDNMKSIFSEKTIKYCQDEYTALEGADMLAILTEWHQFRRPDFDRIKSKMRSSAIFDGRNLFDPAKMRELGFDYTCIGRR